MHKQIFIIDDSQIIRKSVSSHLESRLEHISCVEAADGQDAIQHARELKPDLVIVDLCMPVMNGLETAAALHDMMPRVPIILYTLHKGIVSETRLRDFGIGAVVSKTDQIDILLEEILKHVGIAKAASVH
jgi:CheY-like chemotaxis protein